AEHLQRRLRSEAQLLEAIEPDRAASGADVDIDGRAEVPLERERHHRGGAPRALHVSDASAGLSQLIVQGMPNRSVSAANRLAQNVSCSGISMFPFSASVRKTRSAAAASSI